jgi:uncharacterized protein (TIGR02145 family)
MKKAVILLALLSIAVSAQGTFTDTRDKKKYKTAKIGSQTWMAENLNYNAKGSMCYKNIDANCAKYGRLYDWETAYSACPAGWRLPSADDWDALEKTVGENTAGTKLKSSSGWEIYRQMPAGTDDFGFSALPGGLGYPGGLFDGAGKQGYWWTATEYRSDGSYDASPRNLAYIDEELRQGWKDKTHKFSVRCVQGTDPKRKALPTKAKPVVSTFKDSRDGKTYKKAKIGDQTWMAQNLNYETKNSKCYEDKAKNCTDYGRSYDWYEASEACPAGWHLPSDGELMKMKNYVNSGGGDKVGRKLKAATGWYRNDPSDEPTTGIIRVDAPPGTDEYGFSALPGGRYETYLYRNTDPEGYSGGPETNRKLRCTEGIWWNATEYGDSLAFHWGMSYDSDALSGGATSSFAKKEDGFYSVRCVENAKGYVALPPRQRPSAPVKPTPVAGTFKDSRDGKTYKTVTVGRNIWMAENLNYDAKGSLCYGNSADNCAKYGRLYEWKIATQACPAGWRLPSDEEWSALENLENWKPKENWKTAGTRLKSSSGWENSKVPAGTDSYGFTALPGGNSGFDSDFPFRKVGEIGYWWSGTEVDAVYAWRRTIENTVEKVYRAYYDKRDKYSVRCVQELSKAEIAKLEAANQAAAKTEAVQAKAEPVQAKTEPVQAKTEPVQAKTEPVQAKAEPVQAKTETVQAKAETTQFTDSRDKKVYKKVTVGKQTWMAENLNFAAEGSKCYDNKDANCAKYGKLYAWETAKKSCPAGWHLPSKAEYGELDKSAGGEKTAGKKLKAKSGWNKNGSGTDDYSFTALPGGFGKPDGKFSSVDSYGGWWSADEHNSTDGRNRRIVSDNEGALWGNYNKSGMFSVRCVQD